MRGRALPDPGSPADRQAWLYTGVTAHRRIYPVDNAFRYGVYFLYADLEAFRDLARRLRLFSLNAPNLVAFQDSDHGPRDGSALRPWIDALLAQADVDLEGGAVRLLAFPRVLGTRFYPASFWYCFHRDGTLRAVLAEVNNTFHQHHNYLLHHHGAPLRWGATETAQKVFYVSPFIGMDGRYDFTFSEPDERLSIEILDTVDGAPLLMAGLALERRPLTDAALLEAVLRYGPMSARAWVLIRLQAIGLLRKGLRYSRPAPLPEQETSL